MFENGLTCTLGLHAWEEGTARIGFVLGGGPVVTVLVCKRCGSTRLPRAS